MCKVIQTNCQKTITDDTDEGLWRTLKRYLIVWMCFFIVSVAAIAIMLVLNKWACLGGHARPHVLLGQATIVLPYLMRW